MVEKMQKAEFEGEQLSKRRTSRKLKVRGSMDLKVVSLKKLKMEDKVIQDKDQEKTKRLWKIFEE